MQLSINISNKYKKGEFLEIDDSHFEIEIPANDNSQIFTYLSYNLKFLIEKQILINSCHLNIFPDVKNLDNKILGLLILLKHSKFKSLKISVNYYQSRRDIASKTRFQWMFNYAAVNPLTDISKIFKESDFYNLEDKSYVGGISKRVLPYLVVNEETFDWLFRERVTNFGRIYNFEKTEIDYEALEGNSLSEKNYNLQIQRIGKNNISFIDDLLIQFQSIFNFSSFTNLFDEKIDKFFYAKKYKPKSARDEYFRLESKVKNLMEQIISDNWSNIKLIYFLYIFISDHTSNKSKILSNREFDARIIQIISLTDNICKLLYEASKNVVNHSQQKIGVICTRFSKELITTVPEILLSKYRSILESDELIQISVLDISNFGVTESFLNNIKTKISKIRNDEFGISISPESKVSLLSKLETDSKSVKENRFGFFDFFNPNPEVKILHQDVKSLGHYGLHTFTSKILDTNSTVAFSTIGNNKKDFGFLNSNDEKLNFETYTSNWYHLGTAIEIVMPPNAYGKIDKNSNYNRITYNSNSKVKALSFLNSFEIDKKFINNESHSYYLLKDCDVVKEIYSDEGELIRFMEAEGSDNKSLVFFNLPLKIIEGISLLVYDVYCENWNSNKNFLFVNQTLVDGVNTWEFNIISGRTEQERLQSLNLWANEYPMSSIALSILNKNVELIDRNVPTESPFIFNNAPLPLELFISKEGFFTRNPNESIFSEIVSQHLSKVIKIQ